MVDCVLGFVVALAMLHRCVSELVDGIRILGVILHMTDEFMASTFLTYGNFIGDSLTYLALIRAGRHSLTMMGCISSMLIGILLNPSLMFLISMWQYQDISLSLQTSFLTSILSYAVAAAACLILSLFFISKFRGHSCFCLILSLTYSITIGTIILKSSLPFMRPISFHIF